MKRGFTLIEILVVIAIIAIATGIGLSIPNADKRRVAVEGAARELASYLRSAQSMAVRNRAGYAVVFNISNGSGTSGVVINNWDSGHWYRLLGPGEYDYGQGNHGLAFHPRPTLFISSSDNFNNVPAMMRRVEMSWIGEAQRLPARKVRFLALTDLDNGHSHYQGGTPLQATFPATFPRPWFGWFDAATGRLFPWGGYDPSLRNNGKANAAFYYQGSDPPLVGCLNAVDRISGADFDELGRNYTGVKKVFKAGEVRPLVNGAWLDYYISFRPDGTAQAGRFGELRAESILRGTASDIGLTPNGDIGDMAPSRVDWATPGHWSKPPGTTYDHSFDIPDEVFPASSFQAKSGFWYITLAPDVEYDTDRFASDADAARSMMPAYRVGVSPLGDVRIVMVKPYTSRTLDTSINGEQWQSRSVTDISWQNGTLTSSDGSPIGQPVVDALTPEMLVRRVWWYQ